ncbi:MAG: hypothetical protein A2Z52_01090 [Candidatus Moranbacteria bacterium RBG_19FT_COMBO_42_6]|nr:MAG: hypothetical protein A2Z52_01090 [Candidatus Moranbacteria bacterium RBG_19FT_COMBO_42_6]
MKAKEYAELYKAESVKKDVAETLKKILLMFLDEVEEIRKKRGSTSNSVFHAILNEQSAKWQAFAKHTGNASIRKDGFKNFIRIQMPDIYRSWKG